jgi:hypothetical protein
MALVRHCERRSGRQRGARGQLPWGVAAALVLGGVYLLNGALEHSRYDARFLRSMPAQDQEALEFVAESVPEGEDFAVMPVNAWYADYASEWFPALAEHDSVATTQGYEWVAGEFEDRLDLHDALRRCVADDADCLASIMRRLDISYLYIPSACCDPLGMSVRYSPRFDVLYYRSGALVAELRTPPAASRP